MPNIIDRVNKDFREILGRIDSPETPAKNILKQVNQQFLDQGCYLYGKKPFPIFIKPFFISRERIDYVARVTNVLMGALEKVSDLYFTEPELKDIFELKPAEIELTEIDPGYSRKIRITRNDAFLTDDMLKFIEFNTDSPGGPMYSDMQNKIIASTPVMDELKEKYDFHADYFIPQVLETLMSAYREFGGRKEKPFIALVAAEDAITLPEFLLIAEWLKERGYGSTFNDPRWLEYDGNELRTREGETIDIIYRRGWLPHWTDCMDEIKPLIKAYRDKAVCVVNPPRSILAANKSLLDVVQRPDIQKIFTAEEKKCIEENIPWTRLVREVKTDYKGETIDLYEFIRKNRETLILKPMDQYGGKDVCIGPDADEKKWGEWIERTTKEKFVVQEYVPIPEEQFPVVEPELAWKPKKCNQNFFAYNGKYAGGMVRTSDASIINISAGGGLAPILIVEGEKK